MWKSLKDSGEELNGTFSYKNTGDGHYTTWAENDKNGPEVDHFLFAIGDDCAFDPETGEIRYREDINFEEGRETRDIYINFD